MSDINTWSFPLAPPPKVITFDCYGTLVQWYEVLAREINKVLAAHAEMVADSEAILSSFSAQGRQLTSQIPYRCYKDILGMGFRAAFREFGLAPTADEIDVISSSPKTMGPHREVPGALRRLRERYKLAIFTNSDDDLIAPTVASIGVPFDYVITAEQAQAYKPSRHFFEHAYRTMGVIPDETVHVAMGMYWDMKACHELGVRAIWVNRRGESGVPDWLPYTQVQNMDEVVGLLLPPSR